MIIYPAVDILDGKCVRLKQGRPEKAKVYAEDPLESALKWRDQGASFLHIVDLDGAFTGSFKNLSVIKRIVEKVNIPVQLGGGVRNAEILSTAFELGVARVILGTAAITSPQFVVEAAQNYGQKIAVAIDARGSKITISGWQEETDFKPLEVAQELKKLGILRLVYTNVLADGTLMGLNVGKIKELAEGADLPLIVSGGVSGLDDLKELKKLEPLGVEGVIIGTALYEKKFTLKEAITIGERDAY